MDKVVRLVTELGTSVDWRKMARETPRSQFDTLIHLRFPGPDSLVAIVSADLPCQRVNILVCVQEAPKYDFRMTANGFAPCVTLPDMSAFVVVFSEPWASVRGTETE